MGSAFHAHRQKREARVQKRIVAQRQLLRDATPLALARAQHQADTEVSQLESGRVEGQTLVHVDMDAFYAAVEARDNPQLRTIPMAEKLKAVGSSAMLSTSNYAARRFGVRAAMPGFIARKLCPQLQIVPCHFEKYRAVSRVVQRVLEEYDEGYCMAGLDEAYLNLSQCLRRRKGPRRWARVAFHGPCLCALPRAEAADRPGASVLEESCVRCGELRLRLEDQVQFGVSAEDVVNELRFRVQQETRGLTCSAGIAPNTMLAKIASDMHKPDGQFSVPDDPIAIRDFLADLPTRKVSGIGGVTEAMLKGLGIETVGQIMEHSAELYLTSTPSQFRSLMAAALGLGSTQLESERERKSLSVEQTFAALSGKEEQAEMVEELCESLGASLARKGLQGRTLTLKAKLSDFTVLTRATSLANPISTAQELQAGALGLLEGLRSERGGRLDLRLLGVRLSAFDRDGPPSSAGIAAFLHSPPSSAPGPPPSGPRPAQGGETKKRRVAMPSPPRRKTKPPMGPPITHFFRPTPPP